MTFLDASNVGVAITLAIVFQQLQLGYSLVSTTIPTLKTFVRDFYTGMGLDLASSMSNSGCISKKGRTTLELKARSRDRTGPSPMEASAGNMPQNFRYDLIEHNTTISHSANPRSGSGERSHTTENSQEMFIHHDVDFQVCYE